MTTLNSRYDYGLDLFLLSVDEGIVGYRDDSLEVNDSHFTEEGYYIRDCTNIVVEQAII
jgi:cytoplasmic tRNA 2-thiolation protein 1